MDDILGVILLIFKHFNSKLNTINSIFPYLSFCPPDIFTQYGIFVCFNRFVYDSL